MAPPNGAMNGTLRMEDQAPQLQYQPATATTRRKTTRRLLAAVVAILLLVLGVRLGPFAVQQAKVLYWQHQCMNFHTSGDIVAQTELLMDPSNPQRQQGPTDELMRVSKLGAMEGVVFLHERKTPTGRSKLVIVEAATKGNLPFFSLIPHAFEPATLVKPLTESSPFSFNILPLDADDIRIHEGVIDPVDASHFTIEVRTTHWTLTYDGWVRDDNLILEARPKVAIPPPTSLPALSR